MSEIDKASREIAHGIYHSGKTIYSNPNPS